MRILYFTREYTTHDRRFLAALAQTGHQVYYLRLENRGRTLEDRPLPPGIEIVSWAGGRAPARLALGPRLLLDLKRVIRELKPDLIQAGPLQTAGLLAALTGFRPLVSMSWGYDLIFDARRDVFWRWATRFTLQRSAVMVGDCATIRRLAISYGMPDEKIVTFPWGVDLEHYCPQGPRLLFDDHPGSPRPFTLLSTRGWEPIYGVDVIARAFTRVAREIPELRLLMLGGGSQADLLRRIFREGGIGDNLQGALSGPAQVIYPGLVNQQQLPQYYRSADLYLSASHSDGTSISLLEALACGTPALVSDIPGNREWVQPAAPADEQVGWLFPDGDDRALSAAIHTALENRARLPEMGRAARQLAEQRADWRQNFQELLRAYDLALRVTQR